MSTVRRTVATLALTAAAFGLVTGPALADPPPTSAPAVAAAVDRTAEQRLPRIATEWADAWNSGDPRRLADLFAEDARYTDHAFDAVFTGRDGVAQWATITAQGVTDATVEIRTAFRKGRSVAISWTFTGRLAGAPAPFSVPAVTLLELRGGEIVTDEDFYDLSDVLRQSGLPADWTPGA
jgi:steroid delta-isomerase-like uncharacterized protein